MKVFRVKPDWWMVVKAKDKEEARQMFIAEAFEAVTDNPDWMGVNVLIEELDKKDPEYGDAIEVALY